MGLICGFDIGSKSGKVALLKDERLVGSAIVQRYPRISQTGEKALEEALRTCGAREEDIVLRIAPTRLRGHLPRIDDYPSEIACIAKAAFHFHRDARTILDVGGLEAKAISLDENGKVLTYQVNTKCASGTGHFLENVSEILNTSVDRLSSMAQPAKKATQMTHQCSVFAISEIISLIALKVPIEELVAGVCETVASRIAAMALALPVKGKVIFCGGVSRQEEIRHRLACSLRTTVHLPSFDPRLAVALGAALYGA
jgi:predicted CoA-substrate-specific enzyme activase